MGAFDSFVSRIPDSSENTDFNSELKTRLELAQKAYRKEFGKDLPITSKVRTREEQKDLYKRFKKGESGIYMPLNPDEYPNQKTFHNDAVDISSDVSNDFLKSFGLHRPLGKNDPVHTTIDPSFKAPETPIESTFTSRIPEEAPVYEAPAAPTTGFYNPNLVRQGQNAAPGGGLQNLVENTSKELGGESWKPKYLAKDIAAKADLAYGIVPSTIDFVATPFAKLADIGGSAINSITGKPTVSPNVGTNTLSSLTSTMQNPIGKAFNITEDPAYKNEVATKIIHTIGEYAGKPISYIAEKTGLSEKDIAWFANAAGIKLAPKIGAASNATVEFGGKLAAKAGEGVADASRKIENLQQSFLKYKNQPKSNVSIEPIDLTQSEMTGVGAANVTKQSAVDALVPNLSPETQSFLKSNPIENVNLPALETKALEEKLGIDLSKGQRINDKSVYANEWNARGTNADIQNKFSNQPQQFADSFEKTLDKHASDIGELTKENIGQIQINALANKDKLRISAINKAKQDLVDANGGQFPIDIGKLKENINTELGTQYKSRYLSDAIKGDLEDFYKNPTFEAYEHVRSNLSDEMRNAKDGKSRQAAWIARNEMEKLPIFGEEAGSPQAIALKALADKYRSLNVERYNVLKTNPAYKAAVKEATDVVEAESMESLNAAKFHDKYVTNATPEAVRRMVEELKGSPEAIKALKAGDILNARDALVPNKQTPQLKPDMYNKYLMSQSGKAKYVHDAESLQDLLDYGILSSKVAKPSENVFNYSNSYSAYLGDLLKEGLKVTGEGALALKTGGASIIPMNVGKGLYSKYKSNKFAQETTHPHSGLIEEKP